MLVIVKIVQIFMGVYTYRNCIVTITTSYTYPLQWVLFSLFQYEDLHDFQGYTKKELENWP